MKETIKINNNDYEYISGFICMTKMIGVHNNLFGGELLSKIDEAGAMYVSEKIDSPYVVTLKIGELIFKEPIRVGHLVKIYGRVISIGNSSITIEMIVNRHKPETGKQKIACSTEIVFVHIDPVDGETVPIKKSIKEKFNN